MGDETTERRERCKGRKKRILEVRSRIGVCPGNLTELLNGCEERLIYEAAENKTKEDAT